MNFMPGRSFTGPLPALNREQAGIRDNLRRHVDTLAGDIGERNIWRYTALESAAAYIAASLTSSGYAALPQTFQADGRTVCNIEAVLEGSGQSHVIIGAHYDTVRGSPGANDNASGVAAVLELARLMKGATSRSHLHFVAFVNEEQPFFATDAMGSHRFAQRCVSRKEQVSAMLSLETIGCYRDEPHSQHYPFPFGLIYPDTGDFIGFVGNLKSMKLVRRTIASFRRHAAFPSEAVAAPGWMTGIGWSDHWAFWQAGFPAVMVTDTALFRYAEYHTRADVPAVVDCERMARVVQGLAGVAADLAGARAEN